MTTEEKYKILFDANIDESIWDLCTIDNDGIINTPNNHVLYENGLISEEYYLNWKELIDSNLPLQPSSDDEVSILKGQVDSLKDENTILSEYVLELEMRLINLEKMR